MKLLAIVGSPRVNGHTNYLVEQALEEAAKLGAQTEKIILSQFRVNPCQAHDKCNSFSSCVLKDDAAKILEKFVQADGVILATPVYYYNVSAQLKAFIDRNHILYAHGQKAKAKVVGLIVIASAIGIEDTLSTLKNFVSSSFSVDSRHIFTVSGYAGEAGDIKNNTSMIDEARKLGKQIVGNLTGS
jgi:multimeric flavodoxin WrbA